MGQETSSNSRGLQESAFAAGTLVEGDSSSSGSGPSAVWTGPAARVVVRAQWTTGFVVATVLVVVLRPVVVVMAMVAGRAVVRVVTVVVSM